MEEVKGSIPFSSTPNPLRVGGFGASGARSHLLWGVILGVIRPPRDRADGRLGVRVRAPKTRRGENDKRAPGSLEPDPEEPDGSWNDDPTRTPLVRRRISLEGSWDGPPSTPPSVIVVSARPPISSPLPLREGEGGDEIRSRIVSPRGGDSRRFEEIREPLSGLAPISSVRGGDLSPVSDEIRFPVTRCRGSPPGPIPGASSGPRDRSRSSRLGGPS